MVMDRYLLVQRGSVAIGNRCKGGEDFDGGACVGAYIVFCLGVCVSIFMRVNYLG